jgi:ADP-ribosylglycohydrolase
MVSDDTEHTVMVAQALLVSPRNAIAFQRELSWRLRWWFARLPAGVGLATARSCMKLWLGFPADRSGVFSAGNGPAMRSAIIGVFFAHEPQLRRDYVKAATRLTHTDPKAEVAALAVAEAAAVAARGDESVESWLTHLNALSEDPEWQHVTRRITLTTLFRSHCIRGSKALRISRLR